MPRDINSDSKKKKKSSCCTLAILTRNLSPGSCLLSRLHTSPSTSPQKEPLCGQPRCDLSGKPVNMDMNTHHVAPLSLFLTTVPEASAGRLTLITPVSIGASMSSSSAMGDTMVRVCQHMPRIHTTSRQRRGQHPTRSPGTRILPYPHTARRTNISSPLLLL